MGESQPGRGTWNLTALPRRIERSVVMVSPDMGNLTVPHRERLGARGAGNSASDGHAVESLYVPLIRPGGVAPHKGGFFNETPSLAARHVDHHGDATLVAPTPCPRTKKGSEIYRDIPGIYRDMPRYAGI